MDLPKNRGVSAFAVIVDINRYTKMVSDADGDLIAQFVRDFLDGGISAIEKQNGEIVGFMGDAFLALVPDANAFALSVFAIAKDVDRHCEYLSDNQREDPSLWSFAEGGASLKITAEYGWLDSSTIGSRFLGEQHIFAGNAINHAERIGAAGEGNRCMLGPAAAKLVEAEGYALDGPYFIDGKPHETRFEYHEFDLGDIWVPGPRIPGSETYWG